MESFINLHGNLELLDKLWYAYNNRNLEISFQGLYPAAYKRYTGTYYVQVFIFDIKCKVIDWGIINEQDMYIKNLHGDWRQLTSQEIPGLRLHKTLKDARRYS